MPNELWQYLQSRTPTDLGRDVLDVLITYYIFYRVTLVLKGTRAMQILIGLALVFVLYVVAQVFRLHTVLTIMTAVLSSAILIGVVVFQNDIRRGLMRMGARARLSSGQTLEGKLIDDVVEAAQVLARHRTGAIITFEQEANLDEFVGSHQGHVVDAAVTPELLVSLFIPDAMNKLHDGAVIIRDLRIAKAGVFFPMPEGRVADESFGSRHRAAMGITEETDAVVVVVSEERGTISFCFNGNIIANLDGPRLRAALEGVFAPKRKRKKDVPRFTRLRSWGRRTDAAATSRSVSRRRTAPEAPGSAKPSATLSADPSRPLRELPRHADGGAPSLPKNAQPLRKRPAKSSTRRDSDLGSPTATPNPLRERTSLLPSLPDGSSNVEDATAPASQRPASSQTAPVSQAERPMPEANVSPLGDKPHEPLPESAPASKPNPLSARSAGTSPDLAEPLPLRHLTKRGVTQSGGLPDNATREAHDSGAKLEGASEKAQVLQTTLESGGEPDRATLPTMSHATVPHRSTPVPEAQEVESARGEQ